MRDSLARDPRVSEVLPRERAFSVDNASIFSFFEIADEATNLADALSSYPALRFNEHIEFAVRVPRKNQPLYRSLDDVPVDEYQILWDGLTVYVQWLQNGTVATGSGGHVVLDILQDIGADSGFPIDIIACSPGCKHRFLHADFVSGATRCGDEHRIHAHNQTPVGVSARLPFDANFGDPRQNLRHTFGILHEVLTPFVVAKSAANELLFLEQAVNNLSQELLEIGYRRVARSSLRHPMRRARERLRLIGSSSAIRHNTAAIWLALARSSEVISFWRHYERQLLKVGPERLDERTLEAFDIGADQLNSLDMSVARDAVAEMSTRREGRLLLFATTAGAVAAALGAAAAGVFTR